MARSLSVLVAASLFVTGGIALAAPAAGDAVRASAPVTAPAAAPPLTLLGTERKSARLSELTFSTPYLSEPTKVRVLTPVGYETAPTKRWPVLLLLHGCCDTTPFAMGGYAAWTDKGDAERITKPGRFLVVMPEAGGAGFYTDHYGYAGEGGPAWESYHIRQLLPWVDKHYRTIGTRAQRAVAGLSMGGFGTMSYAARHPDLFSWAESYSGAVDLTLETKGAPVHGSTVVQGLMGLDSRPPETAFGPWETEEVRTRMHGPVDLLGNLRQTTLTLRTGNGKDASGMTTDPVEDTVHDQTVSLHNHLAAAGVPHTFDDYGTGGHTWDKWARGLSQLVQPLNAHFARGSAAVQSFSFTFAETRADVHGYRVLSDRGFLEMATLLASPSSVTVSGSGVFRITTAPRYVAGARYALTSVRNGRSERDVVIADRNGRLSFSVDTGKRSSGQQYRAGTSTLVNQVQVAITRA